MSAGYPRFQVLHLLEFKNQGRSGNPNYRSFKGLAIGPDDPPVYESPAAYLDLHKLLTEEEREYLPADAFVPVPYQDTN